MDPSIPIDIIENVIDQAADDPRLLCQLTLICSQFLPRSRYHLLARHVCLRNRARLEEFCAYLHANPDKRPVIYAVKLRIPSSVLNNEELMTQTLSSTMLVPLLTLPNLRYLGIQPRYSVASDLLGLGSSQLACLKTRTMSITTLDVRHVRFLNATEFARFLFAFPTLRSLRLYAVNLQQDAMGMMLGTAREQPAKQLHLTSLHIKEAVRRPVITLLLKIGRSTIEDLELELVPTDAEGRARIHNLMRDMKVLRSITMAITCNLDDDAQQDLVEAWKMMMKLPTSPPRTHTISIKYTLGHLTFALAKKPLVEKSRQLEQFFLDKTSHSIVFTASRTKRRRMSFWMSTLGRYFPELYERGRLMIECNESSTYDAAGHDSRVDSLAVSPDCKWIASGSPDTTIILWDTRRGRPVQEWPTYAGNVYCMAFSPDSRLLASGSDDRSLIIWDINEGCKRFATLYGHTHRVVACAWSPDGILLASGDWKGSVRVWDTQSFTQLHRFDIGGVARHPFVHFSSDGRWLVFLEGEKNCNIWDTTNRRLHDTLHAGEPFLQYASFDPLNRRIAIAAEDRGVYVWDIESSEGSLNLRGHKGDIKYVVFSPNGDWVLSASQDGMVMIWDAYTGDSIFSFEGRTGVVQSACFSPGGKYVALALGNKTVQLWRTSDGSRINTFTEHTDFVTHVLFSPDGETLCSGAVDGSVVIRQIRDIIP